MIDRINGVNANDSQFRFDISFGSPPTYRAETLRKALEVLGADLIQFGSDRFLPCPGEHIRSAIDDVSALFDELSVETSARQRIMSGTAASWLRIGN